MFIFIKCKRLNRYINKLSVILRYFHIVQNGICDLNLYLNKRTFIWLRLICS